MKWTVLEHPDFQNERKALDQDVQLKLAEQILALEQIGPQLGRPHVDTLNGSRHSRMKEMRFSCKGVWRFAFAFDNDRQAIILVGGNKEGANQKRFYKNLISQADDRFDDWINARE
jgi:hypothetical protein